MAVIHNTTVSPTKLELLAEWLPSQPWYEGPIGPVVFKAGGFRLDDPAGDVGIELMIVNVAGRTYFIPMTYRGEPLDELADALIGTMEHGVLGTRWTYDGLLDPVLQAQLLRLLRGQAEAQMQSQSNTPDPSVLVNDEVTSDYAVRRLLEPGADRPTDTELISVTWQSDDGDVVRGPIVTSS